MISSSLPRGCLVCGGRQNFFFPVIREEGLRRIPSSLDNTPCFTLTPSLVSRFLARVIAVTCLTMVEIRPYTEELAERAFERLFGFRENHLKWPEESNLHSSVFQSFAILKPWLM
ncbi:tRNA (guanine10-N2)-methyltransferase [Apostasia shenzhenica]|uniref:tRNA (Guanine10-N2)-methyltransferase n=1 Tax=Apostasia shenzhenica TaxID=1088818 RepID=A0A2I0B5N0_9ASPA|nr:tRNA (guanine10-N2)-methyltransferase [Apostasia shenzhenica]